MRQFVRFIRDEEGQDLTEYGLLVAFIAFLAVAGVTLFGGALNDFYTRLQGTIDGWAPAGG